MTDLKQLATAVNSHEDWLMVSRDAFLDVCKNTVTDWAKVKGHAKEKELAANIISMMIVNLEHEIGRPIAEVGEEERD